MGILVLFWDPIPLEPILSSGGGVLCRPSVLCVLSILEDMSLPAYVYLGRRLDIIVGACRSDQVSIVLP